MVIVSCQTWVSHQMGVFPIFHWKDSSLETVHFWLKWFSWKSLPAEPPTLQLKYLFLVSLEAASESTGHTVSCTLGTIKFENFNVYEEWCKEEWGNYFLKIKKCCQFLVSSISIILIHLCVCFSTSLTTTKSNATRKALSLFCQQKFVSYLFTVKSYGWSVGSFWGRSQGTPSDDSKPNRSSNGENSEMIPKEHTVAELLNTERGAPLYSVLPALIAHYQLSHTTNAGERTPQRWRAVFIPAEPLAQGLLLLLQIWIYCMNIPVFVVLTKGCYWTPSREHRLLGVPWLF